MVWITKPPLGTQLDWSNPLNQGLVAFWLFNENTGDIVNDLSGNGNIGALIGMSFPSTTTSGWNPGRLGPSIAFDGINDYVDSGSDASLDITGQITIEAWIYSGLLSGWKTIVSKTDNYYLDTNGDEVELGIYASGWKSITTTNADLLPNTWYHIAAVYNDSADNVKIYVNGVENISAAQTYSMTASDTNLWISRSQYGEYFNGTIDEVRIYNRALNIDEIIKMYSNPYGMFVEGCPELLCKLNII